MAFNIFKKKEKDEKKETAKNRPVEKVAASKEGEPRQGREEKKEEAKTETGNQPIKANFTPGAGKILKGFYISEKANRITSFNHYVFKVVKEANKKEIGKSVEKMFNVKVKDVKVLNMPSKSRNVGRHSGTKPGFKKAIVILEEGYSIEQAKA